MRIFFCIFIMLRFLCKRRNSIYYILHWNLNCLIVNLVQFKWHLLASNEFYAHINPCVDLLEREKEENEEEKREHKHVKTLCQNISITKHKFKFVSSAFSFPHTWEPEIIIPWNRYVCFIYISLASYPFFVSSEKRTFLF